MSMSISLVMVLKISSLQFSPGRSGMFLNIKFSLREYPSLCRTFSFSFFNSARNVAISFVREATDSDSDLLLASRDSILD